MAIVSAAGSSPHAQAISSFIGPEPAWRAAGVNRTAKSGRQPTKGFVQRTSVKRAKPVSAEQISSPAAVNRVPANGSPRLRKPIGANRSTGHSLFKTQRRAVIQTRWLVDPISAFRAAGLEGRFSAGTDQTHAD